MPKRLKAQSKSHARAPEQEKETAKRIGGYTTKGSGNGYQKGDVRLRGVMRVENKTTKNKSFSVTKQMVEKLEQAVFGAGEIPVLSIEFAGGEHKVAVMPDWGLDMVLDAVRGKDEPTGSDR